MHPAIEPAKKHNSIFLMNDWNNVFKCASFYILVESYASARNNLTDAEYTSNLESSDELQNKRRRKPSKRIYRSESEEHSSSEEESVLLKTRAVQAYPEPPIIGGSGYAHCSNTPPEMDHTLGNSLQNTCEEIESSFPTKGSSTTSLLSGTDNSNDLGHIKLNQSIMWKVIEDFTSMSERLEAKMDTLLGLVQENNTAVHQTTVNNKEEENHFHKLLESLPAHTEASMRFINEQLTENPSFRKKLIRCLLTVDGRDTKVLASNIVKKLVDDNIASNYSLTGKKFKKRKCLKLFLTFANGNLLIQMKNLLGKASAIG